MEDEVLITQMGLMLTQIRHARRALEDIERSTARYAGFAFASALQAGPSFGAPPLLNGALKVHIDNISDLTPGSGFGGFLESLLGGVGRFVGGLVGGFVGGTISGLALPDMIMNLMTLSGSVERILNKLGFSFGGKDKNKEEEPGPTFKSQLDDIKAIVDAFTALFTSATDPDKSGQLVDPKTDAGVQWLAIFETANSLVRGISRVVDGLIILIPTLVGALASVVVHLRDIQKEVLGLLQFLLKEILMLRGVLLFTLYDTIASAAKLASFVLSTLNGAVQLILTNIANIFSHVFDAGIAVLKFFADGLKRTVDDLLKWLVNTVGLVLEALGDSKIFRVVVHVVQVLPALLPALLRLLERTATDTELQALEKASNKTIADADEKFKGKKLADLIPPFPDLKTTLAPKTELGDLGKKVREELEGAGKELKGAFSSSINALDTIGKKLDEVKKDQPFQDALAKRQASLEESATTLSKKLTEVKVQLDKRPDTGLEMIAKSYEDWLNSGGMKSVLGKIEQHFNDSPTLGTLGRLTHLLDKLFGGDRLGELPGVFGATPEVNRPRATVEIKELLIELDPDADLRFRQPGQELYMASLTTEGDPQDFFHSREDELKQRGFVLAPGALFNLA